MCFSNHRHLFSNFSYIYCHSTLGFSKSFQVSQIFILQEFLVCVEIRCGIGSHRKIKLVQIETAAPRDLIRSKFALTVLFAKYIRNTLFSIQNNLLKTSENFFKDQFRILARYFKCRRPLS